MKTRAYIPFALAPWKGWRLPEFPLPEQGLDALKALGRTIIDKNDRSVHFLEQGGWRVYAKFLTPHPFSLHSLAESLFRSPKVFRIWDVHCAILSRGFHCARPLLSAIKDDGTQLFIAEEVPWTDTHHAFRGNTDEAACLDIVKQLARELARLHQAHIIHGDFLPGNTCLAPDGSVYLLDNDRTALHRLPLLPYTRHRNIIQFCAHAYLYPHIQAQLPDAFLDAYLQSFPADNRQNLLEAIGRRSSLILAERQKKLALR